MSLALAALGLAAYFSRAFRRPLEQLADGAQALEQGRLSHRIAIAGDAEFAAVARSMNTMAASLAAHQERESAHRHRLEEQVQLRTHELQDALEVLRRADARRRQLFADISHELRSPTTAIRGEAEITLRGRDRPAHEYRDALTRIVETSCQLGSVIDDLLAMARSDMEALALVRRPVDLAEPVAAAMVQAAALAHERGIRLHAPSQEDVVWPVQGDPQRLRQLLVVLLDNAIRYSHPGGNVAVTMSRTEDDEVEVEVADEGIGIASAELPQVFERHFRGAEARRHRADGIGLGLTIARALATAHGGALALRSEPGRGTRALLRLPLVLELVE